jgi:hypothetical protein
VGPSRGAPLLALALALGGCSEVHTSHLALVRIEPTADPGCGAPAEARTLRIRALGEFPPEEGTTRSLDVEAGPAVLEGFPADLTGLEVEVLGAGGETLAVGKSAPFAPDDVDRSIPVFTAPPRGACPTGPPGFARSGALLAPAGDGALVAGGRDASGRPVDTLELYDRATATFRALDAELYGSDQAEGLAGASMSALPDGRAVVIGGPATAYQVFDPATDAASPPAFLREVRAHHAAAALPDGRVFLAGGCAELTGGTCVAASALRSTSVLDVDTGELAAGPALARERIGGRALVEGDGRVLVVGGVDPDGVPLDEAERVDPAGVRASERVPGIGGAATRLASGATLGAFAPAGVAASGAVAVIAPAAASARALPGAPPRSGPELVVLEDGGALAIGGGPLWFAPVERQFVAGAAVALPGRAGALRLADGTVLVVGGEREGAAVAEAWLVRPDLTGPMTGSVTVTFGDATAARLAVASDPARASRIEASPGVPAHLRIAGGDPLRPTAWVVVAGPRFARPRVQARVVASAGAALLVGFVDEASYQAVRLVPGRAVDVVRVAGGELEPVAGCAGDPLAPAALGGALDAASAHDLAATLDGTRLSVSLDGTEVLDCALTLEPGLVGLAPLDGELRVDLVNASR